MNRTAPLKQTPMSNSLRTMNFLREQGRREAMRHSTTHRKHWPDADADAEDDLPLKRQRVSGQHTSNHPVLKKELPQPKKSLEMEKVVEKRSSLFTRPQALVTVTVASNGKEDTYSIHKNLLCRNSPFFDRAFNGNFQEGVTQSMNLPEVDVEVFGLLVHWLYEHDIPDEREDHVIDLTESISALPTLIQLAKLWLLGQRALMPALQSDAIKRIEEITRNTPPFDIIRFATWVYEDEFTADTTLRRGACAAMINPSRVPSSSLQACKESLPKELLFDMVIGAGQALSDIKMRNQQRLSNNAGNYPAPRMRRGGPGNAF